jgi:hypothetical protein
MAVVPSWIEAHCVVPDGPRLGQPFRLYDYQLRYVANFYAVRESAAWDPENPARASAFVYRRGILVGPQKVGKNPMIAAQVCVEGVGPALFAGWAGDDDGYACKAHGCPCGWEYPYNPGEPMGMAWSTPLIQITAVSEDSTENTYDALRPMIELGPLGDIIPKTGEEFIRLPGGGRIDTVTSNARSRLGQRVTFAPQDEVGLYTARNGMAKLADTQYRGLAGMGGRASLTSNAWDPTEHSVAQMTFESKADDVYRQMTDPPKALSYANKRERRKIHLAVYPADTLREHGGHVDLDTIEAEAADLAERDSAQAARFFGNRIVSGSGKAVEIEVWNDRRERTPHAPKGQIVIGFDGSRRRDHTAMIATEVATGYQWPLGIWDPAAHDGHIPGEVVTATLEQAIADFDVLRVYADPPYWEDTIASWAGRWGKERIFEWATNRPKAMAYATSTWVESIGAGLLRHCADDELCHRFSEHVGNAVRFDTGYKDERGVPLWIATKAEANGTAKIDSVPAAVLSWEARNDAIADGALEDRESVYETRGALVFG